MTEYRITEYRNKGIDAVVLGCTHYNYIEKEIIDVLGNVKLIDGNLGVAKQAKRKLEEANLLEENEKGQIEIIKR